MNDFEKTNSLDNRFWIQILGDRARLILKSLSSTEKIEIERTARYIVLFDNLLSRARQDLLKDELMEFDKEAEAIIQDFRKYILHLLKIQMTEKLLIDLNPATLNMIVDSTEMNLEILAFYLHNRTPIFNAVVLTSKWVKNIYIDALIIQNDIGIMYFAEREHAGYFARQFLNYYYTSVMLDGLRRTGLDSFPALDQFHDQLQLTLKYFAEYLVDLIVMIEKKRYIGSVTLLFVDSIYRQVCYYMQKLAQVSTIKPPVCDPTSPRME